MSVKWINALMLYPSSLPLMLKEMWTLEYKNPDGAWVESRAWDRQAELVSPVLPVLPQEGLRQIGDRYHWEATALFPWSLGPDWALCQPSLPSVGNLKLAPKKFLRKSGHLFLEMLRGSFLICSQGATHNQQTSGVQMDQKRRTRERAKKGLTDWKVLGRHWCKGSTTQSSGTWEWVTQSRRNRRKYFEESEAGTSLAEVEIGRRWREQRIHQLGPESPSLASAFTVSPWAAAQDPSLGSLSMCSILTNSCMSLVTLLK